MRHYEKMNEHFRVPAVWAWYPYDGVGRIQRLSRRNGHQPELEAWSSSPSQTGHYLTRGAVA
jgi:hypothetical protein